MDLRTSDRVAPPVVQGTPETHAVSQRMNPPLEPAALRRSLWLSGFASMLGALFFCAVQGAVFNFFIEDWA